MGLEQIRQLKENALHPKVKVRKPICKKSAKKLAQEKSPEYKNDKAELEKWFKDIQAKHFTSYGGRCMECGAHIPVEFARHATAHLLPKRIFGSVKTHHLNYLILGAGCGCHDKTHRVDTFVKMDIWGEAANRIKQLIPLLDFDEYRYLSQDLLTALENTK